MHFPVCILYCNKVFFKLPQPLLLFHKKPLFHASILCPICPNPHQDSNSEVVKNEGDCAKRLWLHLGAESYAGVKYQIY